MRCFTFSEFTNIVFIFVLYLYWFQNIVIYFLVISFAQYKEYMICLISVSKFLDVLAAFTCARANGNIWCNCLGLNIFKRASMSGGRLFACVSFYWKYSISESIKNYFSTFIKSIYTFISIFLFLPSALFGLNLSLKSIIFSNKLVWSISVLFILILSV